MCNVCKTVRTAMKSGTVSEADRKGFVQAIGQKIANGTNPEHFDNLLDEMLGTKLQPRNIQAERVFESGRRREDGQGD